jgi:hypothetical protein
MWKYTNDQLDRSASSRCLRHDGSWNCNFPAQLVVKLFFQKIGTNSMRAFAPCATLAFALAAGVSVANAQSLVAQHSYDAFIVQPSGTLVARMPFVTIPEGVIRPVQTVQTTHPEHVAPPVRTVQTSQPEHAAPPMQTVQTIQPKHVAPPVQTAQTNQPEHTAPPIARHRTVASHHVIVRHVATTASSRTLYNYVAPAPTVRRIVVPVVIVPAPALAPGQVLNISGQFQCVEGCAGGLAGAAFVTQNGWDLNLVNELGQPTRAWIDWPGHIWAQNWNEGAVYSPDGMTIQFDNGTVWRRNIELLVLRPSPTGR